MFPVITISREYGSGGHGIAKIVADHLDIPFYDGAIIDQVAVESGFDKAYIKEKDESTSSLENFLMANIFSNSFFESPQDQIYKYQRQFVIEKAKEGPCVIVGRLADIILAEEGIPALNIFIHANREYRIKRIVDVYKDPADEADMIVDKKDKGRKAYYKYYTDTTFGDYENYALSLDSEILGEETCVKYIIDAAIAFGQKYLGEPKK